jgi:DNA-binding transcriptional LysR family regulator
MDLRQIEYTIAVAEELNFTRAASRCHVVQSALSHQIGRLEHELGLKLFERTSRSVRLTPAGETFVRYGRRVLAAADETRAAMAELSGVVTGQLRIGLFGAVFKLAGFEAALSAFNSAHPQVQLQLSEPGSTEMIEQVIAGSLDLAFARDFADQVPAGLAAVELDASPLVAVVGKETPLAALPDASLAELAAAGSFVEPRPGAGIRPVLDLAFATAGVERRVAFEVPDVEDMVRFAALGLGIAIVRQPYAENSPQPIALIPIRDEHARMAVTLVHRLPAPTAPSARAFLAALTQHMPPLRQP